MAGLVGYASSDEDDDESQESQPQPQGGSGPDTVISSKNFSKEGRDHDIQSRPAEAAAQNGATSGFSGAPLHPAEEESAGTMDMRTDEVDPNPPATASVPIRPSSANDDILIGPSRPPSGASAGIAYDEEQDDEIQESAGKEPPLSPYSAERAAVRQATLPRVPDFDIPGSPRSTPPPSLEALNKKFETFLALKRDKGVHFNARLAQSDAMKNPALMDRLLAFVGLGEEDEEEKAAITDSPRESAAAAQYATTLPSTIWDPSAFPPWAYRKPLRALQEETGKHRTRGPGERVEFVPAGGASTSVSGDRGSRSGTPLARGNSGTTSGDGPSTAATMGKQKMRFD